VRLYTLILTLGFGQMFALLSSSQQLFTAYGASAGAFPKWFALMALLAGSGSVLNAKFVVHLGMRRIATAAYLMQVVCSAVMLALVLLGLPMGGAGFAAVFLWSVTVFFMAGVTFGNLNALAMQKMGHLAGMTASVVTALSTVGAVLIAAPVGLMFNGSALPIVCATLICSALAWALMRRTVDLG
jgi:DHA1 family bicyclomycin/chloramphenicol resistance-like MFS transporter